MFTTTAPAGPQKFPYPIVTFGDPILEKPSAKVEKFDASLKSLVADLFRAAIDLRGFGMAAPQLGVPLRVAVVDVSAGNDPAKRITLVNPEIVPQVCKPEDVSFDDDDFQSVTEACFSLPGIRSALIRPMYVNVRAQKETGEPFEMMSEGIEAQAVCHEIDHLNGVLFFEHLSRLKKDLILTKIRKRMRRGQWISKGTEVSYRG